MIKMAERLEHINPQILYLFLVIIMVLAFLIHLSPDNTYSLVTLFLLIVVVLGNIGYLYNKFRKPEQASLPS